MSIDLTYGGNMRSNFAPQSRWVHLGAESLRRFQRSLDLKRVVGKVVAKPELFKIWILTDLSLRLLGISLKIPDGIIVFLYGVGAFRYSLWWKIQGGYRANSKASWKVFSWKWNFNKNEILSRRRVLCKWMWVSNIDSWHDLILSPEISQSMRG